MRSSRWIRLICDVLLEVGTCIGGTYIAWADRVTTPEEEAHWLSEHRAVQHRVWDVGSRDESAVRATLAELTALWRSMSADAPALNR